MTAPQIPLALTPPRRLLFDNFIPGPNQTILDVLKTGLEPGQWYFLSGQAQSGRSHLAHAVFDRALRNDQDARFVACSVSAAFNVLDQTRAEWVILDDVDAIAGVDEAERALFNALNTWRASHTGLLMTGRDRTSFVLPDLRSRLNQAAHLKLSPLQSGSDVAFSQLIEQLLEDFQLKPGYGIVDYLLRRAPRSPSRLVDLFEQLSEQARAERRVLSIPLARSHLDVQRSDSDAGNKKPT